MNSPQARRIRWFLLALTLAALAAFAFYGLITLRPGDSGEWRVTAHLLGGLCLALGAYGMVEFHRGWRGLPPLLSAKLPHVVVGLALLTALVVLPSLLRANKRPSGTTMKADLRLIDDPKATPRQP